MSDSNGKPAVVHKGYVTTRPFMVEEEADQEPVRYTIRTMKGRAKSEWQNFMADRVKYSPAGKPIGVSKFEGLEASLITRCMFHPDGRAVTEGEVDDWPAPLISAAFKECQEVNGLTTGSEDAAKK